jgi:oligopeptide transport system ATP-binding protein
MTAISALEVVDLAVDFSVRRSSLFKSGGRILHALDGVSFELAKGETLGIVGESGCGKSTLARAILQLVPPSRGRILRYGEDLGTLGPNELRERRKDMQIIFQDPLAALDPRMTAGEIIGEPLTTYHPGMKTAERQGQVMIAMMAVGLSPEMLNRYPHEFSGGQCQRIGIARAMVLEPSLVICDEPVSALDVSIRAQIINLLMQLQSELDLSLIFVSHDLSVVSYVSHRIMVLYMGRVMEIARRDELFSNPQHPYTQALISAVPIPDPETEQNRQRIVLEGELPSPLSPPSGCHFRTRCHKADALCAAEVPVLTKIANGHRVACHHLNA